MSTTLQRLVAAAFVAAGLVFLAASHARYGLVAQVGIVPNIIPLLFAGLMLGRLGVWVTASSYLGIFVLGALVDFRHGAGVGDADILANLLQSALGCLLVALILDRLIAKSRAGERRSRELAAACEQLEIEIREKEESQAQLVHSQRMDALGKLASNVVHDFNNLLGVILGYVRQAEQRAGGDDAMREILDRTEAAVWRGKGYTDKLLSLARRGPPEPETFDVNEAIADLEPLVRSLFAGEIVVAVMPGMQPATVHMDRGEFDAIVLNIAKNASDAMSGGGRFLIYAGTTGQEAVIEFRDTGHGMSPEVARRAFEPFFTTKARGQGSGIGLAVAYRAVSEAEGRIDVDSAPGQGTCFTLHLPLRNPGDAEPVATTSARHFDAPAAKPRVLHGARRDQRPAEAHDPAADRTAAAEPSPRA